MTRSSFFSNILALLAVSLASTAACRSIMADGHEPSDSIIQQWQITHQEARLKATGTITLTGKSGDQFLLLRAPAVLTKFEGAGLRVTRRDVPGVGLCYVVHVGSPDNANAGDAAATAAKTYTATFEYQLESIRPADGLAVLTGAAALQEVTVSYDEAGWEVAGPTAIRIEQLEAAAVGDARLVAAVDHAVVHALADAPRVHQAGRQRIGVVGRAEAVAPHVG